MSNTQASSNSVNAMALAAEMMANDSTVNKLQQLTPQELADQIEEQSIANAIQQIEQNQTSSSVALDQIKRYLTSLSQGGSDAEVTDWVNQELNTANGYNPPSSILNQLNKDINTLDRGEGYQDDYHNDYNECESKIASLEAELSKLKSEMSGAHWWDKIKYAVEIAGVGIAIGAVETGAKFVQYGLFNSSMIEHDQEKVDADTARLNASIHPFVSMMGMQAGELQTVTQERIQQNQAMVKEAITQGDQAASMAQMLATETQNK
jgi:hypothetical protein